MAPIRSAPDQDLIWREYFDYSEDTMLAPARTLFVAKSWPVGFDASICFTDPQSAMNAAAALSPPPDVNNPAVIIFYPGTYSTPVVLVSNVHLFGHNTRGCALTGAITWTPGAGVNASQAGLFERVYCARMGLSGAINIDCTGKASMGVGTTFDTRDVDITGSVTALGRALSGGADDFQTWDCINSSGAWLFDGMVPLFNAGTQIGGSLAIHNGAFGAAFNAAVVFAPVSLVNTPGTSGQGNKFNVVNVDATSVFGPHPGSKVGLVTVASGGSADLRGVEYFANSNLAGAGAIDRSVWRTTFGATAAGNNTVPIAPPYIDANYNVSLTLTAGPGGVIKVTSKAADHFVLNDAAGGNTFDVTLSKE